MYTTDDAIMSYLIDDGCLNVVLNKLAANTTCAGYFVSIL